MSNDCMHFRESIKIGDKVCTICELTNTILKEKCYLECELYNLDLSDREICFNCKHFLGGNDWGLSCAREYHRLTEALSPMCEEAEVK